jgi:hypothetical protein
LDADIRIANARIALLRTIDLDPRAHDTPIRFVIGAAHEQAKKDDEPPSAHGISPHVYPGPKAR